MQSETLSQKKKWNHLSATIENLQNYQECLEKCTDEASQIAINTKKFILWDSLCKIILNKKTIWNGKWKYKENNLMGTPETEKLCKVKDMIK